MAIKTPKQAAEACVNEADIAWAAGLFDGEGHIGYVVRNKGYTYMQLILSMTDKSPVQRFSDIVKLPLKINKGKTIKGKRIYTVKTNKQQEVHRIMNLLCDYLSAPKIEKYIEAGCNRLYYEREIMPKNIKNKGFGYDSA